MSNISSCFSFFRSLGCVKDERFSAIRCRLYNCRSCLTSCRIFISNWLDVSLAIRKKNVLFKASARKTWMEAADDCDEVDIVSFCFFSSPLTLVSHPQPPFSGLTDKDGSLSYSSSRSIKIEFLIVFLQSFLNYALLQQDEFE